MYGYNLVAIDTKGRISLPSKYRESLKNFEASKVIITRDPQYPSLKLYPKKLGIIFHQTLFLYRHLIQS